MKILRKTDEENVVAISAVLYKPVCDVTCLQIQSFPWEFENAPPNNTSEPERHMVH